MVSEEMEKAWEDIGSLKKEVRSLKTRLGKLTGRVNQLDLIGFQDQLSRLDERITRLSSDLTSVRQREFQIICTMLREIAGMNVHLMAHVPPFPPTWHQGSELCTRELQGYYLQAWERIKHCNDAQEMEESLNAYWDQLNVALGRYGCSKIGRTR